MTAPATYPYSSGDLLESRNTYFYTKFEGSAFLSAWRAQREATQLLIANQPARPAAILDISPIIELLANICLDLTNAHPKPHTLQHLNHLVQRFEVSKRLHDSYDANWRPVNTQRYHGIERYIRLGEALSLAHDRTGELPYLNALLKCIDTLTSMAEQLDHSQGIRVNQLISDEHKYVERLSAQHNVQA